MKKTLDDAGSRTKEFNETLKQKTDQLFPEENRAEVRKNLQEAGQKMAEGAKTAGKKVNEFMAKPEVQDALQEAGRKSKELADKAGEMLKDLFGKTGE